MGFLASSFFAGAFCNAPEGEWRPRRGGGEKSRKLCRVFPQVATLPSWRRQRKMLCYKPQGQVPFYIEKRKGGAGAYRAGSPTSFSPAHAAPLLPHRFSSRGSSCRSRIVSSGICRAASSASLFLPGLVMPLPQRFLRHLPHRFRRIAFPPGARHAAPAAFSPAHAAPLPRRFSARRQAGRAGRGNALAQQSPAAGGGGAWRERPAGRSRSRWA